MIHNSRFTFTLFLLAVIVVVIYRIATPRGQVAAKVITVHSRGLVFQEERQDATVHGITIDLHPKLNITLVDGGGEMATTTDAVTVDDLLLQKKIPLARTDRVSPALNTFLTEGLRVSIDRIVDIEETMRSEIPFRVELAYNPDEYYGAEAVIENGVAGMREQKFLVTYKNGIETRRRKLAENILKEPASERRSFGTKIEVHETVQGRASWYDYKKCLCAAAPYYPRGRYVRVTSLASNKSIIVKINDSGPDTTRYPDRVLDLDVVAYREIASPSTGTVGVKVELLRSE